MVTMNMYVQMEKIVKKAVVMPSMSHFARSSVIPKY